VRQLRATFLRCDGKRCRPYGALLLIVRWKPSRQLVLLLLLLLLCLWQQDSGSSSLTAYTVLAVRELCRVCAVTAAAWQEPFGTVWRGYCLYAALLLEQQQCSGSTRCCNLRDFAQQLRTRDWVYVCLRTCLCSFVCVGVCVCDSWSNAVVQSVGLTALLHSVLRGVEKHISSSCLCCS
jgi:hypothetical protein